MPSESAVMEERWHRRILERRTLAWKNTGEKNADGKERWQKRMPAEKHQ